MRREKKGVKYNIYRGNLKHKSQLSVTSRDKKCVKGPVFMDSAGLAGCDEGWEFLEYNRDRKRIRILCEQEKQLHAD